MKYKYFLLFVIFFISNSLQAQWITLYEGGNNTTESLRDNWIGSFYFSPDNSGDDGASITSLGTVDNNYQILYYFTPFGAGSAGIYKEIPTMENYLSVRVKLRMHLSDTVGVITYNSGLTINAGGPDSLWTEFGSDVLDEYVYLTNTEGHNNIFFNTDLLRGDSVFLSYDYVLIEADTTQMLSIPIPEVVSDFEIVPTVSGFDVIPAQLNNNYDFLLYDLKGDLLIQQSVHGKQVFAEEFESGIYFAVLSNGVNSSRKKVFLH